MFRNTRSYVIAASFCLVALVLAGPALASSTRHFQTPIFFLGADNDNIDNPTIQPSPDLPNQSLDNADVLEGGMGNDVIVGRLGSDTIIAGGGNDITIGGPEGFVAPNKDVILGGPGNDVNVWAPGDGSDAYLGGDGLDAQVFGFIDRDDEGAPALTSAPGFRRNGAPTVDVSGSPGFCLLERADAAETGFQWLVRFVVRSSGNIAVTIRLRDVEQVFCTAEAGGEIFWADLTSTNPELMPISTADIAAVNPTVAEIVR